MNIFAHATYVGNSGYNSHCKNFFRNLNKYHEVKIRNFTIGPSWKGLQGKDGNPHGSDVNNLDKEMMILQTLWNENKKLEDFEIYGYKKGSFKHDINIVLAETNHYFFYHNYEGLKIAYFVWESTKIHDPFFQKLKEFDQVWVPSKWQEDCLIAQGMPRNKVKVVPEGVDSGIFYPEKTKHSEQKFKFLIFGRWDNRKSTMELIRAFKNVFGNNPKVELLISVEDKFNADGLGSTKNRINNFNLNSDNIKILDFPSKEEYAKILKSGHVFLSCSRSEGWNLPLIEAMACGTPSIYSNCSGQLEFASGKGIPVKIIGEVETKNFYPAGTICQGNWYEPDFKDLEEKMLEVYNNYEFYKKKAVEESEEIRAKFSWNNSAKIADDLICKILNVESKEDKSVRKINRIEQLEKFKNFCPETYKEVVDYNTYENYCKVEDGDTVLDIGCSRGVFYFKNKNKNIKYFGVDASSDGIKDFYNFLIEEDNPIIINAILKKEKEVSLVKPFYYDAPSKLVAPLSFKNLMNLMPQKINFLKFDIEGGEKEILLDNDNYNLFKEKVEKFSGEIHLKGPQESISTQEALNIIKKLKNDPDICCKIHSLDGKPVDFYFDVDNEDYYYQIIISGIVKKNSRLEYMPFEACSVSENGVYNIVNESPCLGDVVAWVPMVDKFQKEKKALVNFYSPYGELFQSVYPNINFDYYNNQPPKEQEGILRLAASDIGGKKWSQYNLQELAAKHLGVKYEPTKGKIATPNRPKNNFKKKYVCIATQSTAQFKYWNNPTGWQETVDYLKSLDYDVVCIDKYPFFGHGNNMNSIPKGCIDKTGEFTLMERINDLMYCEFFIGLTSGLSWLAWALGKKVVFISGISLPHTDFPNPYRVTNTDPNLCHGCADGPDFVFDQSNWMFCPKNKNFECTREISFSMVKEKIDALIKDRNTIEQDNKTTEENNLDVEVDFSKGVSIKIKDNKYKNYIVKLYYLSKGEWCPFFEDLSASCGFEYENCIDSLDWKCSIYKYEDKKINLIFEKIHTR
jgi:autotransporter strand-loop-strand O-heptosyltransferase